MHIFFVDDSAQSKPQRPKMGPMIGVGGLVVESSQIRPLETELDNLCEGCGFPRDAVFKWSPGTEHWMRKNLVDTTRRDFQLAVLQCLAKHECKAVFIAEDKNCSTAERDSLNHEMDIVKLLIERVDWYLEQVNSHGLIITDRPCVDWYLEQVNSHGLIITDRPGGDHRQEESFLINCLEALKTGTGYRIPSKIIMSVLTSPFRLSRILQAADLIASCTMAYVCGEGRFSPPIFEHINPLFIRESNRVGGVGVKLHPFMKFGNLYHWLFGDTHYWRGNVGQPLPLNSIAFSKSAHEY